MSTMRTLPCTKCSTPKRRFSDGTPAFSDTFSSVGSSNHFDPLPTPDQPGDHTEVVDDLTDDEFASVTSPDADALDVRGRVEVAYIRRPENPEWNTFDALYDDRVATVEQSPILEDVERVTVEVVYGDCFRFTHRSGTWMFVGVHELDEQTLLFVPVDSEARDAPRYPAYHTAKRGDFGPKLGANRGFHVVVRVEPVHDTVLAAAEQTPTVKDRLRTQFHDLAESIRTVLSAATE